MKLAKEAVILLSGGQDSATCLAWALHEGFSVKAIQFDYAQRHRIELELAKQLCLKLNIDLVRMSVPQFAQLNPNSLTHNLPLSQQHNQLPSSFVPGRNLIFLNLAAIYAYQFGITELITGVCQTDYSGYPDCRETFIESAQSSLSLALDRPIKIHTPLMHLSKADTVRLMARLKCLEWYALTHTCYEGQSPACGKCPACQLRLKGFKEAGLKDPLEYQNY